MKAVVVYGSPRQKKSASYHVADNFAKGLKRAGVQVEEIMLIKHKIKHCLGCYTCWTSTPGKCVQRDDMDFILPKVMEADLIVIATPLYIFQATGLVKDFLDRIIPMAEPYLIELDGSTTHPMRGTTKRRKIFLISVAGFPERSHFDGLVLSFKRFAGPKGYVGDILIPGSEMMSKDGFQKGFVELYKDIEQAGFEVAKNGAISEETKKAIEEKTTYSEDQVNKFRHVANKYWKSLQPKDYSQVQVNKVDTEPLKMSDKGMGTFLAGMASMYNPNAVPGLRAVVQFNLDDDHYHLIINEDECQAYEGPHKEPTTTIISPANVWMDVSMGKLDGAQSLMKGLYKVEGDMNILLKMNKIFRRK